MPKLDEITYDINQRWWVKPLIYSAAYGYALLGKSQFPRWFTDFIVTHGYRIEWKDK
jgi:hypothetical protein